MCVYFFCLFFSALNSSTDTDLCTFVDKRVGQHGLCCLVSTTAEPERQHVAQTPERFRTDDGGREGVLCWSSRLCCISVEAWFFIVALVCICVCPGGTVTAPPMDVVTVFQTLSFMECAAFIVTFGESRFRFFFLSVSFVFIILFYFLHFRTARVQV